MGDVWAIFDNCVYNIRWYSLHIEMSSIYILYVVTMRKKLVLIWKCTEKLFKISFKKIVFIIFINIFLL